jgi:hypothetical protein
MTGPKRSQLLVAGHTLEFGGRGHYHHGRLFPQVGDSGVKPDRGRCSCGELSPPLPSDGARKRWHRAHKEAIVAGAVA